MTPHEKEKMVENSLEFLKIQQCCPESSFHEKYIIVALFCIIECTVDGILTECDQEC